MDKRAPVGGFQIKQRIKEFQKQHLLAASEALYAVLADMKAQGEVLFSKNSSNYCFGIFTRT